MRLALGYVERGAADRALARIQDEEDGGTIRRVLKLHVERPKAALAYLMDGDGAERWLELAPDYEAWALERYVREIFAPWREEDAPRSWINERRNWAVILPKIGDLPLGEVDAFVVADFVDGLVASRGPRKGLPASGNYKRLMREAMRACLTYAYRRKHIPRMPDLGTFRIKGATKTVLEQSDPLTVDEFKRLLDVSPPGLRVLWAVGVGLGLRPAELVKVHWEDVDWEQRLLDVRGSKTEAAKDTIPITPVAYKHLQEWWRACEEPATGVVFRGRRGPYGPQGYRKALNRCAVDAGIERHMTPNLLRHSFATIAWSLGIEEDVARRVLRHTSDEMLKRVYSRPRPADLVSRVEAFALDDE